MRKLYSPTGGNCLPFISEMQFCPSLLAFNRSSASTDKLSQKSCKQNQVATAQCFLSGDNNLNELGHMEV
jgi:hypothetical protein